LTHKIEAFKPLKKGQVTIYSCGPTVYDHAHIGNLSAYIYSDILTRLVKLATGESVKRVMNFTDVDDKTIRDSRLRHAKMEPMQALTSLTREFEGIFKEEMREVGNDISDIHFVRATEYIRQIQELVLRLLGESIAYKADDGIYFSIKAYQKTRIYGQLSKISVGNSRIDNDEYDKAAAGDFALWKKQKSGEPAWDFEVEGEDFRGRPGWHIECSAMSVSNLGQPFDIHTGSVDNIFPHHENEIAQSTAGDQPETMARYFFHNEHLLVDGKKMSKSLHNFYKLSDITDKEFSPLAFRLLVLQGNYRKKTNFSWENLEAASNRLNHWKNVFELTYQTENSSDEAQLEKVNELVDKAIAEMMNDMNTAEALKYIDEAFALFSDPADVNHLALTALAVFCSRELGLSIISLTDDITDKQKSKIVEREEAKSARDFAEADAIRDELSGEGIELLDTKNGTIWQRA
jgi:cysteinyl-tRNA synthetase